MEVGVADLELHDVGRGTAATATAKLITLVRQPYLQQVTSTSAVVVWATREPGDRQAACHRPAGRRGGNGGGHEHALRRDGDRHGRRLLPARGAAVRSGTSDHIHLRHHRRGRGPEAVTDYVQDRAAAGGFDRHVRRLRRQRHWFHATAVRLPRCSQGELRHRAARRRHRLRRGRGTGGGDLPDDARLVLHAVSPLAAGTAGVPVDRQPRQPRRRTRTAVHTWTCTCCRRRGQAPRIPITPSAITASTTGRST